MPTRHSLARSVVLVSAFALVAAACGGDDESGRQASVPIDSAAATSEVSTLTTEVTATDGTVAPTASPTSVAATTTAPSSTTVSSTAPASSSTSTSAVSSNPSASTSNPIATSQAPVLATSLTTTTSTTSTTSTVESSVAPSTASISAPADTVDSTAAAATYEPDVSSSSPDSTADSSVDTTADSSVDSTADSSVDSTADSAVDSSVPADVIGLAPGPAPECSATAIASATGQVISGDVTCQSGWAVAPGEGCDNATCATARVFHASGSGWISDGVHDSTQACGLLGSGMQLATAELIAPPCDGIDPSGESVLRNGDTGAQVTALQIALVAEGYPLLADGQFGDRTEAAVSNYQDANELTVDGAAGPETQFALGIGPDPSGGSPTDSTPVEGSVSSDVPASSDVLSSSDVPSASDVPAAPDEPSSSDVVSSAPADTTDGSNPAAGITAGDPPECAPEAIAADLDDELDGDVECHSGWATGTLTTCRETSCPGVDVFKLTQDGWVYVTNLFDGCAENLVFAGMTFATASSFAGRCTDRAIERVAIEPGTSSLDVAALQGALVAVGYPIAVDGVYGSVTADAVSDFQSQNDLEPDGIATPETQEALGI